MNKLEIAREKINKIDKEMAILFEKRMLAAELVAEYKKENGLPIFDASREEAIIKNNSVYINKDEIKKYYVNFQREVMKISRNYQSCILNGMNENHLNTTRFAVLSRSEHIKTTNKPDNHIDLK